jgi:uncharacterized phiE125 gp8 family phage protein
LVSPLVITGPTTEPISLAEVKSQLRIDGSTEDTLLNLYIAAAREYCENRTGRTFHQQTLEWVLDAFPSGSSITLPRATPLIAISSVKYKDSDGTETTWSSAEYIADTDSVPGGLVLGYNESWPSFTPYPVSPIRIRYTAGIATTSPVTEASDLIKTPHLLLVGGLYENRESEITEAGLTRISLEYGVEAFLSQLEVAHVF